MEDWLTILIRRLIALVLENLRRLPLANGSTVAEGRKACVGCESDQMKVQRITLSSEVGAAASHVIVRGDECLQ